MDPRLNSDCLTSFSVVEFEADARLRCDSNFNFILDLFFLQSSIKEHNIVQCIILDSVSKIENKYNDRC